MTFLDIEKAFDRVNRNKLWQILNKRGIPYHLIEVIKAYTKIPVYKLTILDKIYINQGVRQGC